jgi:signal transduction histidine kinase
MNMKIRTKLTLLYASLTAVVILLFACAVYYAAHNSREIEFYQALKKEAITKANVLLNAKVDAQILQKIYLNNRETLNEVEVAVYDSLFQLIYHDAVEIDLVKETEEMIMDILKKGEVRVSDEKFQAVGITFLHQGRTYVVTAAAYDEYGFNKLTALRNILGVSWMASMLVLFAVGRYYAGKVLEPIRSMVEGVNEITANNLNLRVPSGHDSRDELTELADTFNQMLDRLEASFDAQKQFVSNISHEIRTPLAAMMAEITLALNSGKSSPANQQTMANILDDAKKMARLSNNLLDLAKASYDVTQIHFQEVRVDETLLDASEQVMKQNPGYKVAICYGQAASENSLPALKANEYLLKVAWANLIENGCKFSSTQNVEVFIETHPGSICIRFKDQGIGIAEEEMANLFSPFHRSAATRHLPGHGIGLSLTKKIIDLHQGSIGVTSRPGKGTVFTVTLPGIF